MTASIREIAGEVVLGQADGLFTDSAITLGIIQTVEKAKVDAFITHRSADRKGSVGRAIGFALGFDALK